MLTHPTLDQMHQLGLAGMARAFAELEANPQSADLSHAEWLGLLLDREVTERYERRLRARLRYARLRHQASVEDVDYRAARGLDRSLFQAMIAGRWIEDAVWDATTFTKNRDRLLEGEVAGKFLAAVLSQDKVKRPAATTARSSISACRGCSAISRSLAAMAATLD